ncbi:MAG: HAMP domain-containing histidine kinase, partial [Gammaproteobacteria bacterium]|nr:HAMP domain-containing histidine kinase [Gammaproteobacteria bacterium]
MATSFDPSSTTDTRRAAMRLYARMPIDSVKNDSEFDEKRVFIDQVKQVYAKSVIPAIATLINSTIVAAVLWPVSEPARIITWLVLLWSINGIRYISIKRFRRKTVVDYAIAKRWGEYFEFGMVAVGLLWGLSIFLLLPDTPLIYLVFISFVLGGMSAGAVGAFSHRLKVVYAYIIPAFVPLAVLLLISGDSVRLGMGFMIVLYVVLMLGLAKQTNKTLSDSLCLQYENIRLAEFYKNAKDSLEALYSALREESDRTSDALKSLRARNNQIKKLLDSAPLLLLSIDRSGRIVGVEGDWSGMPGSRALKIGDDVFKVFADDEVLIPLFRDSLSAKEGGGVYEIGDRTFEIHTWPVIEANRTVGAAMIAMDISSQLVADRKKRQFVETMSHEMRTPLTSVYGALKLLTSGSMQANTNDAGKLLSMAYRNSEQLLNLTNDVILHADLEKGHYNYHAIELRVDELVKDIAISREMVGGETDVAIRIDANANDAKVMLDRILFSKMMDSIISNAVKHSPQDAEVVIATSMHEHEGVEYVRVSISDQGPGIPAQYREEVFEKFSRVDSSDARQNYGIGIGLSLARQIVKLIKGKISFTDGE